MTIAACVANNLQMTTKTVFAIITVKIAKALRIKTTMAFATIVRHMVAEKVKAIMVWGTDMATGKAEAMCKAVINEVK